MDQNSNTAPPAHSAQTVEKAAAAVISYLAEEGPRRRRQARWEVGKIALWMIFVGASVGLVMAPRVKAMLVGMFTTSPQRIAVVPLKGQIAAGSSVSAEGLVPLIENACSEKGVEVVVLDVDSPGGAPVEADRIGAALKFCKKPGQSRKVVAVINSLGASAAYLAAMHADEIIADRYALVGSVGAIIRTVDASGLASRLGVGETVIASGELKKGASMLTPASPQATAVTQDLVDRVARTFADAVVSARGDRLKADRAALMSGRLWTAQEAKDMGLIDELGTFEEWRATNYPDAVVDRQRPPRSLRESLGLDAMTRMVIDGMERIEVR